MKTCQYKGEEAEYIRIANPNDPGFTGKGPTDFSLALIRLDGEKLVVPVADVLVAIEHTEPTATTISTGAPAGKKKRERH